MNFREALKHINYLLKVLSMKTNLKNMRDHLVNPQTNAVDGIYDFIMDGTVVNDAETVQDTENGKKKKPKKSDSKDSGDKKQ
jgi:hypothetical protein